MYTWMVLGILMASGEARVTLKGVPFWVPAPVQRLVPACRLTPERPGSIVKVTVPGATPETAWVVNAALVFETLKVSLPPPRLLIFRLAVAKPRWQGSCARKTAVL